MPVVLGMWSCSVTILVCLTIWDLLGFVLLDLLLGGRAMHVLLTTIYLGRQYNKVREHIWVRCMLPSTYRNIPPT